MLILGVDTSCDDTSIAVLKADADKFELLSNIVSSQDEIHKKYGGVYPLLARRAHEENLPKVLDEALARAKVRIKDIDAISITIGPGLDPCLWVGLNFVKDLASDWKVPIIPVNHIEGHILANLLKPVGPKIKFPAICLVVSGGHTQLILMKKIGKYEILGETRDDAAGECFDKTARILGLGYPGGPAIAEQAAKARQNNLPSEIISPKAKLPLSGISQGELSIKLPRPMFYTKDYDFSFSGLKTAVLYDYKKKSVRERKSKRYIQAMSAEIQQAIIDVLLKKTIKASRDYKVKTVMLGGGVVANQELRTQFQNKIQNDTNCGFHVPDLEFCNDNGAMMAITGWFNREKAVKSARKIENLRPNPNLRI